MRNPLDPRLKIGFHDLLLYLLLTLICSQNSLVSASTVFYLQNGDRITGDIISEKSDSVLIRSLAGEINIPLNQIDHRENSVKNLGGSPKPPLIQPIAGTQKQATNLVAAVTLAPLKAQITNHLTPTWFAPLLTNWSVSLQIGSDLGFGNSDRQSFYANGTALHRWDRVREAITYTAAFGQLQNVESANRMDGTIKTDVDLGSRRRIYAFNLAGTGYDEVRRLDLQYQEGTGLGYKLIQRPKLILNTEIGAQFQHFDFASTGQDRSLISARLGEDLVWEISKKLKLRQSFAFMPNFADFTDFRAHYSMNFSYPLLDHTSINLNLIDDYDTNPVQGVKSNDMTVQTTIGISF